MINDNAKAWIEALRSGEFEQTTGGLHDQTGYCCLGVACEVYSQKTGQGRWDSTRPEDDHYIFRSSATTGEAGLLPFEVSEWLGLNDTDGSYLGDDQDDSLVELNDGGVPFSRIADVIASEPKGLFR